MTSDGRGDGEGGPERPISDAELASRRAQLDQSLARVKALREQAEKPAVANFGTNYSKAFRLASEFTGCVLVGALLGWGIDSLAGTSPIGLIVLLLLGFAAGVMAMVRTSRMPD